MIVTFIIREPGIRFNRKNMNMAGKTGKPGINKNQENRDREFNFFVKTGN
jgi:hypothetical protein